MSQTPASPASAVFRKIALVTGASRGLGAALAETLAARGWHIVAVARTTGGLEELDDRIKRAGGSATLAPLDVTNDDAMRHLAASIGQRWGHLDLWAHTALQAPPLSPAGHIGVKDLDKALAACLRATAVLIPLVEPLLRAAPAQGSALFFEDESRFADGASRPFFGPYAVAKAGQIALAQSWAAENAAINAAGAGRAPRVVIARPAPMPTATRGRFFPGEPRELQSDCAAEAVKALALAGV